MDAPKTEEKCSSAVDEIGEPVEKKRKLEEKSINGDEENKSTKAAEAEGSVAESEKITNKHIEAENGNEDDKTTMTTFSEKDVGILEYIGEHKGFSATIKQRYSDFIVNEIDSNGDIVHLKDLSLPADDKEEEPVESKESNEEVVNAEDWKKVKEIVAQEDKKSTVNIPAPDDKEMRTKIHLAVKKSFPQLETKTVDENGTKFIQVLWKKGNSRGSQEDWPKSKKDCRYVKFVLYKENKDTIDAIGLMAKNLKVRDNLFQYAGTKDKRAKTTQEITAHNIHPKKLFTLNKVLYNFGLGDFRYVKEPLFLGQTTGNHFTIVLRNVQANSKDIDVALESLKNRGFINYFGMQRFGTHTVPTHSVGLALLCCDWSKAIDLIISSRAREDKTSKDTYQTIWSNTKNASAALDVTPRFCHIEWNLLAGLAKGMAPLNALEKKVPRNLKTMYVHGYQAYIWNKIVSRRLKELGRSPVVGDLVIPQTDVKKHQNIEKVEPLIVTEDNISQFSLSDVVMPLPGVKVTYPSNEVKCWYQELMHADGLDIDKMERKQK